MEGGLNVTGEASWDSRLDGGSERASGRPGEPSRGRSFRSEVPPRGRRDGTLGPSGPEKQFAFRSSRGSTGSALRMSQRCEDTGLERRTRRNSFLAWRTDTLVGSARSRADAVFRRTPAWAGTQPKSSGSRHSQKSASHRTTFVRGKPDPHTHWLFNPPTSHRMTNAWGPEKLLSRHPGSNLCGTHPGLKPGTSNAGCHRAPG